MSDTPFPASAMSFVPVSTPKRTRIFLLTDEDHSRNRPRLSQVTTINSNPETASQLVDALNEAAWTGNRALLDQLLEAMPEPVVQACSQALEECPDPSDLALGLDDAPMRVLRTMNFSEYTDDLAVNANAAMDLELQFLVENAIDERGALDFEAKLLSEDREVSPGQVASWWPVPSGMALIERAHPSPSDLADAFRDARWGTHVARAYWLWVKDSDDQDKYEATAEWVVEFLDAPLSPETNFRVFVHDDDLEQEERGYFTTRTRFMLWLSLRNMSSDLDELTASWPEHDSIVKEDMPSLVQSQPRDWWRAMSKSADRLCDAARRGCWEELVPRTPAEEALLSLATRPGYVDWARDSVELFDLEGVYHALQTSEDDEVWQEILGGLTGDVDIEMLWNPELVDSADPTDEINRHLGMGDYRPQAWHRLFERAIPPLSGLQSHT